MTLAFDDILARLTPAEDVVWLCLDASKVVALRQLERDFVDAPTEATSLAERSPASVIAEQIEALRAQMKGSETPFRVRALSPRRWQAFALREPARTKDESDDAYADRWQTYLCEMVAACAVEPTMTPDQAAVLADALPSSSWNLLAGTAMSLNMGSVSVPFSVAVSATTPASGQTSTPQPASGSPSANGGAPRRRRSPRTPTTTPAA